MERVIYAYATPAVAAKLGLGPDLDEMVIIMEDRRMGVAHMMESLRSFMAENNHPSIRAEGLPNVHPHAGLMGALLQVLQGFAVMAFACSAAVAAYVVSLWMKREVRQVGIMKTVGATTRQLAVQYLALVGPFVVAATAVALPIGILLGRWAIAYTAHEQNLDIENWQVSPQLFTGEILFTLGIPFLAMAAPIIRAARMSAREAIQDPGITAPVSSGALSAKLVRLPGDRRWAFALRNTFRRKWRLFITVAGLTLGGTVLLSAFDIYESLMSVIDIAVSDRGQDLQFTVQKPIPIAELEAIGRGLPGVEVAEAWRRTSAELISTSTAPAPEPGAAAAINAGPKRFLVYGYPVDTHLKKLPVTAGRWPQPGEAGAVVISRPLQRSVPGLGIGSEMELQFRSQRARVRVVGLVNELAVSVMYVDSVNYEAMTGVIGLATELRLKIDPAKLDVVLPALDQAILDARVSSSAIGTRWEFRKSMDEHFSNFVVVCTVVALATALVGGIGLVAFTSLGILERTREIGVIRAVGATPGNVTALFLAESGSTALLSFVLAAGLSYPVTYIFNQFVGNNAFAMPVPVVVSKLALVILFSGLLVVMVAVALTISRLLRLSVRDALAYE
jgi:putative ABC transport system permease protein